MAVPLASVAAVLEAILYNPMPLPGWASIFAFGHILPGTCIWVKATLEWPTAVRSRKRPHHWYQPWSRPPIPWEMPVCITIFLNKRSHSHISNIHKAPLWGALCFLRTALQLQKRLNQTQPETAIDSKNNRRFIPGGPGEHRGCSWASAKAVEPRKSFATARGNPPGRRLG